MKNAGSSIFNVAALMLIAVVATAQQRKPRVVPSDAQPGHTIHVILEATDNGTPPLTRYQRLIVRIQ